MEVVGKLYRRLIAAVSGDPKGIQRPTGGHLVSLNWTMSNIYDMKEGDRWWAASDLGWVVGHSYICYAPLLAGLTSVGLLISFLSLYRLLQILAGYFSCLHNDFVILFFLSLPLVELLVC